MNITCNTHELKILPKWFEDVQEGRKNFEIRRNDRDFKEGDYLLLKEWDRGEYTGREITRMIQYIYQGDGSYGLSDDYCILGIYSEETKLLIEKTIEILPQLTDAIVENLPRILDDIDICQECEYRKTSVSEADNGKKSDMG